MSLEDAETGKVLVWPDSAKYAIEEYIFARSYMYQNVYQHKTTRGFEKIIHSAWQRAEQLENEGNNAGFVREINDFRHSDDPTVAQYLALEDATLIYQLKVWSGHEDEVLSDLANRFLARKRLKALSDPVPDEAFEDVREHWEEALRKLVGEKGYESPECYALRDDLKQGVYNPYYPEKEKEEQDPYNAILISTEDGPTEISDVLIRLKHVTGKLPEQYRYYVPDDVFDAAKILSESDKWR